MIKFENRTIVDEELILSNDVVNALGPNLRLQDCSVVSRASRKALILGSFEMVGGSFEAKVKLFEGFWDTAKLDGVTFSGTYSGCNFGPSKSLGTNGYVRNCDFSSAKLDGCRFLETDMSTIELPKWPYITVLNPRDKIEAVKEIDWPGRVGFTMGVYVDEPEGSSAVTIDANRWIKKYDVSEAELKEALSKLEGVVF